IEDLRNQLLGSGQVAEALVNCCEPPIGFHVVWSQLPQTLECLLRIGPCLQTELCTPYDSQSFRFPSEPARLVGEQTQISPPAGNTGPTQLFAEVMRHDFEYGRLRRLEVR